MLRESRACVAGGITSIMDMPNIRPPTLDRDAQEAKYAHAAIGSAINQACHMGASNDNLIDPLATPGVKVFIGASTGNMLVDDPEILHGIFRECPTPIITHCEGTPMRVRSMRWRGRSTVRTFPHVSTR